MDQEETREIQEEETNVPKDGKKGMNLYTLIVLSVAAVLIFAWMMFGDGGPSGKNGKTDPQSKKCRRAISASPLIAVRFICLFLSSRRT